MTTAIPPAAGCIRWTCGKHSRDLNNSLTPSFMDDTDIDNGVHPVWGSMGYIYIYLRAAAPAADPGRIGKPSERIYGTGLHPPQKKKGKGCSWDSFTRIVACYGFYVKGERAFLGVDVFCDVCCKTFLVKTFHPNLVDYFRGVSLIGSGFVEVVRVLKFSFIQLRFEKKGMYH